MTYYCKLELSNCSNGGYTVDFPDIEGICTEGDNKEHTLAMAKEALNAVLECDLDSRFDIPSAVNRRDEGIFPIEVNKDIAKRILTSKIEALQEELKSLETEEVKTVKLCTTC